MSSIKLTADSGGGTFEIKAPSSSGNTRVLTLPDTGNITVPDTNGITMADSWYVGAGLDPSSGTNTITANWTRNTATEVGSIGSAMTQSSGLFSFPSTGIYYMCINGGYYRNNTSEHNYLGFTIQATGNNGTSYYTAASVYNALPSQSGNTYSSMTTYFIFDCTDTSTHKVRFATEADAGGTSIVDIAGRRFNVIFIRLGDT